jgi:N-acetylneuraminate synthase
MYLMMRVNTIAEIGINHNGDIELAKKMIMTAKAAGFDYVKFQKRNPNVCVPENEKNKIKSTPWGEMTYLEYKWKLEFNEPQYRQLINYCDKLEIEAFASVWDKDSVDFMSQFTKTMKIPSALITDLELCSYARDKSTELMISTGMSTEDEVMKCIIKIDPDVIFHTNSSYPSPSEELNLHYITHLNAWFPEKQIGYSGHELGLTTSFAAVALGATWIERHVTLDRELWGSDQKASVEPIGQFELIKGIREIEKATMYKAGPRLLFTSELAKRKTLRGV